jgi:hypothetical protein
MLGLSCRVHSLTAAPFPVPAEFCDSLCKETWKVGGGKLEVIGGNVPAPKEAVSFIQQDEMVDAFGASPPRPPLMCLPHAALLFRPILAVPWRPQLLHGLV